MKNLVAKAGAIAVTSVLIPCVAFAPEANALDLTPSDLGILVNATGSVNDTVLYDLEGRGSANPALNEPGVVEVGEFYYDDQTNIEMRGYVQFDLSSLIPGNLTQAQHIAAYGEYFINFDILTQGGSGTAGNGSRNNLNNPYTGVIDVLWYTGEAIRRDPLLFNPEGLGESPYDPVGFGETYNPFFSFTVGDGQSVAGDYEVGDRVRIDVTNLVKNMLIDPYISQSNYQTRLGIMLRASSLSGDSGQCGGVDQRKCQGVTFNNFGATAVPTPAAILPSLFGLATAAMRRKKHQDSES